MPIKSHSDALDVLKALWPAFFLALKIGTIFVRRFVTRLRGPYRYLLSRRSYTNAFLVRWIAFVKETLPSPTYSLTASAFSTNSKDICFFLSQLIKYSIGLFARYRCYFYHNHSITRKQVFNNEVVTFVKWIHIHLILSVHDGNHQVKRWNCTCLRIAEKCIVFENSYSDYN